MQNKKIAFVSDFDGTISDEDFFTYTTNAYFDDEALFPWREYIAGRKHHFDALKEMFAEIHVDESELIALIDKIHIDKALLEVLELCKSKNIPIYVCSAGNDYYIRHLIGKEIKKYNITLISNHGEYNKKDGLVMSAPEKTNPFYDEKVGISKYKAVKKLKDDGYFVIFAGDGPPDFEPAKIADVVFAKKILLEKCIEAGIKTKTFNSFDDIYNFIRSF